MRRRISPTVKTPHTIASPTIKGVHVQFIGHLDSLQARWATPPRRGCGSEPTILDLEERPNASIIDPLASGEGENRPGAVGHPTGSTNVGQGPELIPLPAAFWPLL